MWLWKLSLLCGVVTWSLPVAAVVGGAPAAPPEPDAAVVFVQRHGLNARLEGIKDNRKGYYTFAGIRYAEPPVGQRRFQRPVRRLLSGDVTAKQQCQPCPQMDPRGSGRVIGQEDCLCINVFAPKMPGDEQGCPVVFFIHGGNYRTGSTAAYGGEHFTKQDTIIVTAQYRLGSLGYLSTGTRDASGNTGLFDLHTAMAWIRDYIEFFGGDRSRVVIMGQGSGGSAASLLALSPEGRSAAGVAALSGAPLSPGAVRSDPGQYARELAERTGCPSEPAERLLMCLRKMSMAKIVQADKNITMNMVNTQQFLDEISGRSGAGVRVEGGDDARALPPLVAKQPSESINSEDPLCPMLTGVTSAETSRAVFGKYGKFLTNQLKAVKNFIKKDLIGGLRGVVGEVSALVPPEVAGLLPLPDYYQALFDSSLDAVDGLTEIAEATGDALFNFPAYQSVREWSAVAPAFLYSFEHVGNLSKGSHFIPGIALTQSSQDNSDVKPKVNGPSHGDELAYLFEALDDEGKPIGGAVSDIDARVRESFVGLIAKFAHNTGQNSKNATKAMKSMDLLPYPKLVPFSKDSEQYLKISDKITIDKNFRFCQMGLWGNMADRLTGAFCKNVLGSLLNLPKLIPTGLPVSALDNPSVPIFGGLIPGQKNQRTTKRPGLNNPLKIFDI